MRIVSEIAKFSGIVIGLGLLYALFIRSDLEVTTEPLRNPLYVLQSDGAVRNIYDLRIRNKLGEAREFRLSLTSDEVLRIRIPVGVAYGSDVQLVTSLLLQAGRSHQDVLAFPEPKVQFKDFGASSLDFVLHYYSHNFIGSEFVKSDLRYEIMDLFDKNEISIPFPQRDIWIKSGDLP